MSLPLDLVRRTRHFLRPDPTRVISQIFLPGQELALGESRSATVLRRVLSLSKTETEADLTALRAAFEQRHQGLTKIWQDHYDLVAHRIDGRTPSPEQQLLIGAAFTQEITLEGSSLCNPSMVAHPDQSGLVPGSTRFVLTLRAIGEGHISRVEWRTGVIDAADTLTWDDLPTATAVGSTTSGRYDRAVFRHRLTDLLNDPANATFVLAGLDEVFDRGELDQALHKLHDQRLTRGLAPRTVEHVEAIASASYTVTFDGQSAINQRVLIPSSPAERQGIEDVRIAAMTMLDGEVSYVGTYTAYSGTAVQLHLLRTCDFTTFSMVPLSGPGARDKGLAIFPRPIGGRYFALSRADRETNAISASSDLLRWEQPVVIQRPQSGWDLVHLGNCGPPIETAQGWLVLTHGVGPMRTYGIGALLLDLDNPLIVLGRLHSPLLMPERQERSGYVPNVVYSCGAMLHGDTLVLPYGCSDTFTRIALVNLTDLLRLLQRDTSTP